MLLKACEREFIAVEKSVLIGDRGSDIGAAHAAKLKHAFLYTVQSSKNEVERVSSSIGRDFFTVIDDDNGLIDRVLSRMT
jgi:histidinol phosphatase-like enzyme